MFQRPGPYYEVHRGADHPWFGALLCLVLLGALVLAAVMLWRTYRHPAALPPTASAAPPARDPALAELRLRYARGEIDRDEYLQRATDLGDTVVAAPPPVESPQSDT